MDAMTMGVRRRIMTLCERGWTTARIAEALGRSRSGVWRIRLQFRERSQSKPLKPGIKRPYKIRDEDRQRLAELHADQPDAKLRDLCDACDMDVLISTINRLLHALKISKKKYADRSATTHGSTHERCWLSVEPACKEENRERLWLVQDDLCLARSQWIGRWKLAQHMQLTVAAYNLVRLREG